MSYFAQQEQILNLPDSLDQLKKQSEMEHPRFDKKIFKCHNKKEFSHFDHIYKISKIWNLDNKDAKIINDNDNFDLTIEMSRPIYYDENNNVKGFGKWKVTKYELKY